MTDDFGTIDEHGLIWALFLSEFEGFVEDSEATLKNFLETIRDDTELRELARPILSAISAIIQAGNSSSEEHKNKVLKALSILSEKEEVGSEEEAIQQVKEDTERSLVFAELCNFLSDEFEIDKINDFQRMNITLVEFTEKVNTFAENKGIDFRISPGATPSSTDYPQFKEHLEQAKSQFYIVTSDMSFALRFVTNQLSLFFYDHNDDNRKWLKL